MKKTLGQVLKTRRETLQLSQRELARRLGVRASHVGYLETAQRRPSLSLLARLGAVLGLDTESLLLLALPEARVLLPRSAPAEAPSRDHSWKTFSRDRGLLKRHRVTRNELRVLSRVNALGQISAPRHYLFILNAIRYAVDEE